MRFILIWFQNIAMLQNWYYLNRIHKEYINHIVNFKYLMHIELLRKLNKPSIRILPKLPKFLQIKKVVIVVWGASLKDILLISPLYVNYIFYKLFSNIKHA
jgi:hypothetical protein